VEEIRIQIKRIRPSSSVEVPLPTYMTEGSAGMDLYADIEGEFRLAPLERVLIPTGIAIAMPPGFEAQIRPRSGLALKQGLTIANSPGTIDSDYRGEIQLIAINLGKVPVVIRRGQRIAQMIIQRVIRAEWREVEELPPSKRQGEGFGHTDEGKTAQSSKFPKFKGKTKDASNS
jgi:dUTP pyrophosphatase